MCDESAYSYHVVHVLCRNCERRRHSGHDYRLSPLTLVTSLWERWYVIFWPRASPTAVCQSVAEYYEAYLRQPVASAVSGLRGVYSDTTQLNWTQLNQLNSVQPSQSCFVYDVMTYKLSQLLFTLWTCRQLDVELSSVEFSWVELCRYKHPFSWKRHVGVFHVALFATSCPSYLSCTVSEISPFLYESADYMAVNDHYERSFFSYTTTETVTHAWPLYLTS